MKTEIHNLIILDESGSMGCVRKQTISGCNETIDSIRTAQEKYEGEQRHFVSIYAFNSRGTNPSRYIIKNEKAESAGHVTEGMYNPCGCTPLYDAIGATLVDLKATIGNMEAAVGSVTIITDGMENASRHYDLGRVAAMIDSLKELGWNFNFIGANFNVEKVASSLNIDNSLNFRQDEEGTKEMFAIQGDSRMRYLKRLKNVCCTFADLDSEEGRKERRRKMREASEGFFSKE